MGGVKVSGTSNYRAAFDSPFGPFELDDDGWIVFAHAEENQAAIHFLDQPFRSSGLFQREGVDPTEYDQPGRSSQREHCLLERLREWVAQWGRSSHG